jgi:hypothetical protein
MQAKGVARIYEPGAVGDIEANVNVTFPAGFVATLREQALKEMVRVAYVTCGGAEKEVYELSVILAGDDSPNIDFNLETVLSELIAEASYSEIYQLKHMFDRLMVGINEQVAENEKLLAEEAEEEKNKSK